MTQFIPAKALAKLSDDVKLLEIGTAEETHDFTVYKDDPVGFTRAVRNAMGWTRPRFERMWN